MEPRFDTLPEALITLIAFFIGEYKQPDLGGREHASSVEERLRVRKVRAKYAKNPMLRRGHVDFASMRKPNIDDYVTSLYDVLILDPQNLLNTRPYCPSCGLGLAAPPPPSRHALCGLLEVGAPSFGRMAQ